MDGQKRTPAGRTARGTRFYRKDFTYSTKPSTARLPADWRARIERLDVVGYYARRVSKLTAPNASGWCSGPCPFHNDAHASLSVHVTNRRGGWKCFASCGGGDLIGFEMKLTGKTFAEAVAGLLRGDQ